MLLKRSSITIPINLLLIVIILTFNHSLALSELPDDDISVNCGSSGSSNGEHGQQWIGDIGSKFIVSSQGSKAKSIKSIATDPYKTARISHQQFGYGFHVSPGPKFIRLYFHPNTYPGFKRTNGFFTVKAGPYTLLNNFSASITADSLGVNYFVKEFCVSVEENQLLIITFSPSIEAYAFVNGIEIISMPPGLYYTPMSEPGPSVVGKNYQLSIDKSVALEMVHRLNVGGSSISSSEDTGLSREWSDDSNFIVKSDFHPVSMPIRIKYRSIPNYTAPQKLYQTSWSAILTKQAGESYNFTWKLPVDLGFRYLIRFHFCELEYVIDESIRLRFDILINDQMAEASADVITWTGGSGIAMFKDYVAMMEGDRMEGKRDLFISLNRNGSNYDDWWAESTDTILKGLEVFKLSNTDNNLAGVNPKPMAQALSSGMHSTWKFAYARGGDSIASVIVILISMLSIIVYKLRILGEQYGDNKISSSSESLSRRFSLAEVRSATNNFDNLMVIGSGGFGLVYKGVIDGGAITVAIKRLNSKSKQGAEEFWTEIDMLSKLRHTHLVSLIGYCDEGKEMILVYEFMEHGTLADHLYKIRSNGVTNFDLSWEQKLNICIGAARGLDYLHTGTLHGVIHRDVKTTNILLDNEWVAKVSDFGLCKIGTKNLSHVSTNVKGTFGYMDPEYFLTHRLTKKSDVYAFGVVLLEVLSGRPAVDISLGEEVHSLALWAQHCFKEGKIDDLIDPTLRGQITSPCLKLFTKVAFKCLYNRSHDRPTMSDVVVSLEGALISQSEARELSSVHNEEKEDTSDDESDKSNMSSDTYQLNELDGVFQKDKKPSALTERKKKKNRTERNLRKVFQWSTRLLFKEKNKGHASSISSSSDRLDWDNTYLLSRQFSIADIRAATNNFSTKGQLKVTTVQRGFSSRVYKGWIDNGTLEVVIKCIDKNKKKAESFAFAEIKAHSQLRHLHVISLIGYCADRGKLMLVYSYMINGSLEDQLYLQRTGLSPLPWTKRLEICIGVAKGLQYLHYGTTQKIIHGDVKPSHILLDENWVAKISSFESSKVGEPGYESGPIGTSGYIAPEYIKFGDLNEKTDVYAFGVVLLEVVSARKPIDSSLDEEKKLLVEWFRTCLRHKKIDQIIDPYLVGKISPECLMQYLKIAWNCLHDLDSQRPTMNSVVESLQIALQLQEAWYKGDEFDQLWT